MQLYMISVLTAFHLTINYNYDVAMLQRKDSNPKLNYSIGIAVRPWSNRFQPPVILFAILTIYRLKLSQTAPECNIQ